MSVMMAVADLGSATVVFTPIEPMKSATRSGSVGLTFTVVWLKRRLLATVARRFLDTDAA
jgi:hypothetical protein